MATQCAGFNKDGTACSAMVKPGETYCIWHDPAKAAKRATWNSKGGQAVALKRKKIKEALEDGDIDGLSLILFSALDRLNQGRLDPTRANAMANVARAILAVREQTTLAARLEKIEAILNDELEVSNG